jgi:hypothetical protein
LGAVSGEVPGFAAVQSRVRWYSVVSHLSNRTFDLTSTGAHLGREAAVSDQVVLHVPADRQLVADLFDGPESRPGPGLVVGGGHGAMGEAARAPSVVELLDSRLQPWERSRWSSRSCV